MAHPAVHIATGLVVGSAIVLPRIVRAWNRGDRLAALAAKGLAVCWALAILSILPGLLRAVCLPSSFCSGWWMNVCMFYPLLDHLKRGGMLVGELGVAACLALQYVLLLAALRRAVGRNIRPHSTREHSPT